MDDHYRDLVQFNFGRKPVQLETWVGEGWELFDYVFWRYSTLGLFWRDYS